MRKRRTVAWLVALAVGLTLVPATQALAASTHEKKQDARIAKVNRRVSAVVKKATKTANKVAGLTTALQDQTQALVNLTTLTNAIDGRLKFIEGAAPAIVQGLTDLKAGLEKLGAAYQAVEYGRAGIFAGDADLTVAAGGTVTSADIPDDGNAITTGENAVVVAGAGATGESLNLRAAIRSNESDGDTTGETAGQAGGYIFVVNNDTRGRGACTRAPKPPRIFGATPRGSIVTPSGTVTNLPLKNIPGGVLRTDTSKPDATSTSLLPAACSFTATPGGTYEVHYSVNFVDIPTTTTPGPTE